MPLTIFCRLVVLAVCVLGATSSAIAGDTNRLLNDIIRNGVGRIVNDAFRSQDKRIQSNLGRYSDRELNSNKISSTQIIKVQQSLNYLGFNVGAVDGKIGGGTRNAIKIYQTSIGVRPTGYINSAQLATLVAIGSEGQADVATGLQAQNLQTTGVGDDETPLTTTEILLLQKSLNALGYNAGKADGKLGRGTGNAVTRFLTDRNRDPDTTPARQAVALAAELAGFEYHNKQSDPVLAVRSDNESDELHQASEELKPDALPRQLASTASWTDAPALQGLAYLDGAVFLDGSKAPAIQSFLRLCFLASDPKDIEYEGLTIKYGRLIPPDRWGRYFSGASVDRVTGSWSASWRGSNEFEQADSRNAFLENEKDYILSLVPSTPFALTDAEEVWIEAYDKVKGAFDWRSAHTNAAIDTLQANLEFPGDDNARWAWLPVPLRWPDSLKMNEQAAREFLSRVYELSDDENKKYGAGRHANILARYIVTGLRRAEPGVVFDLAIESAEIVPDNKQFSPKLWDLPIPGNALRSQNAQSEDASDQAGPEFYDFDAELPYLLALSANPALKDDDLFIRDMGAARKQVESGMLRGSYKSVWPAHLPPSVVLSNAELSKEEKETFADWSTGRAKTIAAGGLIRAWAGDQKYFDIKSGVLAVDIVHVLKRLQNGRLVDFGEAGDFIHKYYPYAARAAKIATGESLKAAMVQRVNPAWSVAKVDLAAHGIDPAASFEYAVDIRLLDVRMAQTPVGKRSVLFEVEPARVVFQTADGQIINVDIPPHPPRTPRELVGSDGFFEMQDLRIGQTMQEALEVARKQIGYETSRVVDITDLPPGFDQGAAILPIEAGNSSPLVALLGFRGRLLGYAGYAPLASKRDVAKKLDRLISRFGTPGSGDDLSDFSITWYADKGVSALTRSGSSYCSDHRGDWYEFDRSSAVVGAPKVTNACGEILVMYPRADVGLQYLVINTDLPALFQSDPELIAELVTVSPAQKIESPTQEPLAAQPATEFEASRPDREFDILGVGLSGKFDNQRAAAAAALRDSVNSYNGFLLHNWSSAREAMMRTYTFMQFADDDLGKEARQQISKALDSRRDMAGRLTIDRGILYRAEDANDGLPSQEIGVYRQEEETVAVIRYLDTKANGLTPDVIAAALNDKYGKSDMMVEQNGALLFQWFGNAAKISTQEKFEACRVELADVGNAIQDMRLFKTGSAKKASNSRSSYPSDDEIMQFRMRRQLEARLAEQRALASLGGDEVVKQAPPRQGDSLIISPYSWVSLTDPSTKADQILAYLDWKLEDCGTVLLAFVSGRHFIVALYDTDSLVRGRSVDHNEQIDFPEAKRDEPKKPQVKL